MELGLEGRVVWITGASGGIGSGLASAFAAEGARLLLTAHGHAARADALVRENGWEERALVRSADVTDADALGEAADAARARFGRLDAVIVNAGIWPPEDTPLHEMSVERLRQVLDVDLLGALLTARAFLGALATDGPHPDGGGASITFIGSTAGRFGERGHVEYAAAKSGLRGVTSTLKNEIVHLDPEGRVNLVEPGWVVTEMTKDALDDEVAVRRVLSTMARRKIATPSDIAAAAVWLASPTAARHITGEVLTLAGGMEGRRLWVDDEIDVSVSNPLRGA